jgi:hypothetical protein
MNYHELNQLLEHLPQASALDLYRIAFIARSLYNEPKQILAIRLKVHVGMKIQYFDSRVGQTYNGTITALREANCAVLDSERQLQFAKLPYAALDFSIAPMAPAPAATSPEPTATPKPATLNKQDFRVGQRVSFLDRQHNIQIGTIQRMNPQTASVNADHTEGYWRIDYSLLRHIVEQ